PVACSFVAYPISRTELSRECNLTTRAFPRKIVAASSGYAEVYIAAVVVVARGPANASFQLWIAPSRSFTPVWELHGLGNSNAEISVHSAIIVGRSCCDTIIYHPVSALDTG